MPPASRRQLSMYPGQYCKRKGSNLEGRPIGRPFQRFCLWTKVLAFRRTYKQPRRLLCWKHGGRFLLRGGQSMEILLLLDCRLDSSPPSLVRFLLLGRQPREMPHLLDCRFIPKLPRLGAHFRLLGRQPMEILRLLDCKLNSSPPSLDALSYSGIGHFPLLRNRSMAILFRLDGWLIIPMPRNPDI